MKLKSALVGLSLWSGIAAGSTGCSVDHATCQTTDGVCIGFAGPKVADAASTCTSLQGTFTAGTNNCAVTSHDCLVGGLLDGYIVYYSDSDFTAEGAASDCTFRGGSFQ